MRGIKVKLYPNKEQEILFKKSCGLARYAYNWGLNYQKENFVVEDLNIQGMLKNKHLSKQIHAVAWYRFIKFLEYKSETYGIEFIKADRFYPSSKKCSKCGYMKKDLKLKDRIFQCSYCGNTIDRDFNASINLANYIQKDKLEECNI